MADATFWNAIADEYSRKPVELPEAFERKIAITRALMNPQDTVLDIGCGTGTLALRLATAGRTLHGLDLSPEMVRIARDKALAQGEEEVHFHEGPFDATAPFAPGSLDGICAYSILHLLDDRQAALQQIFTLLKPGGFLVSSTPCLGDTWIPYGPLIAVMRLFGRAPAVVNSVRCEALVEEMSAVGFVDIERPDVGAKPTTAFLVARKR